MSAAGVAAPPVLPEEVEQSEEYASGTTGLLAWLEEVPDSDASDELEGTLERVAASLVFEQFSPFIRAHTLDLAATFLRLDQQG